MTTYRGIVAASSLAVLIYPVLVYVGLGWFGVNVLAGLFLLLFALRLGLMLLARRSGDDRRLQVMDRIAWLAAVLGLLLAMAALLTRSTGALLYYPVAVNAVLLFCFAASLWQGPSVAEMLARMQQPDLPEAAVRYTRRVTIAWCLFFMLNGTIALYTAWQPDIRLWALYNGLLAYLAIGAMFVVEWCIRQVVQQRIAATEDTR